MATNYSWRPGAQIKIDAAKAGRELARLDKDNGGVTPDAVVERARSSNSSLHEHFEWDDSLAAHQHRLGQAGDLIRSIVVDISPSNVEPPKPVRAFVNVVEREQRHYTSTARAMSDVDLRRQVLERAWNELQVIRRKYADLKELSAVFAAIDRVRPAA